MRELFEAYFQNSLSLSVVALLIIAFSPLLSRRYSAKCRYYLWLAVFAALLFPIRPKINITLPEVLPSILPTGATDVTAILPTGTMQIPSAANTWDWFQYAVLLWGIGMAGFLGWHAFQHLRFLSAVRRWSGDIKDTAALKLFRRSKAELGIRDSIIINSCACIKTPMVIGLLRPVVLIPQSSFHQDELAFILKHELVHYRRRDLWYKVLMMLVLSIHWFNPVIHLMVKSALNLCEISCDEEVLKEIDAKGRAEYGEAIIGVIRNRSRSTCQTALSTNFYSGPKGVKQRIYAMMDRTEKRFSPILLFAVLMITLGGTVTFALSPAQAQDIVSASNSTSKDIVAFGLPGAKIQPPQGNSVPDTDDDTAAKSEINDSNLPANEAAPGNDIEYPETNSKFTYTIVSQEGNNAFWEERGSSLIGLYCYDENGGVKMTREMLEAIKSRN